jgi:hypothetical protein
MIINAAATINIILSSPTWCRLCQQLRKSNTALLICWCANSALALCWVNQHVANPRVHAARLCALQQPKQAFPAIFAERLLHWLLAFCCFLNTSWVRLACTAAEPYAWHATTC